MIADDAGAGSNTEFHGHFAIGHVPVDEPADIRILAHDDGFLIAVEVFDIHADLVAIVPEPSPVTLVIEGKFDIRLETHRPRKGGKQKKGNEGRQFFEQIDQHILSFLFF